ncbi:hypothetical protein SAMD00019534_026310 [Acytostelium subglobosum LB1]|uniref:hypothetical protein n=1 Tax=Acytostelium subglobosum LB1 TaxID=1410327 RepID=UPI000644EAFD|nr:hypothetical protein SAMD00019534_026310 [Acytostelium subglobosum LB1]GAM19456.1 hypothetical protein SAMD00019534_026310 [Acytostelium subglobosum LB1]|eukprot:XP_012757383.1 hypothetical protein SAMD00019534_026310 [Acytostelium subglobosum LB1]
MTCCETNSLGTGFICFDCNVLEIIAKKDYNALWCLPRLNQLWKTLQQCASSYQSLEQTNTSITEQFEQLIKVIISQEHNVKAPIREQMDHIQSTMNNIINEINNINHIINPSSLSQISNIDSNDIDEVSQKISSINLYTSIEQYITNTVPTQQQSLNDDTGDTMPPNVKAKDIELLTMISNHIKHTQQVLYDEATTKRLEANQVRIKVDKLNGVKRQIESSFKLIKSYYTSGHAILFNLQGGQLLDLESLHWSPIDNVFNTSIQGYSTASIVHAGDSVYVFGTENSPERYYQYSLTKKKGHCAGMVGVSPGRFASTCYDGDQHIYLVGGKTSDGLLDRVDCFNIATQQFRQVGRLPVGISQANIFFDKDILYIVGGEVTPPYVNHGILTFDLKTLATKQLVKNEIWFQNRAMCFDGLDNLYFLESTGLAKSQTLRYTLSNKQTTRLAHHPCVCYSQLLYDQVDDVIYQFGGKGKNYKYSVEDNKWTTIKDNDQFNDHIWSGACLFR